MKLHGNIFRPCVALVAAILALVGPTFGQTAEEHASHHPAPGGVVSPAPPGSAAPASMPTPGGSNPAPTAAGTTGGDQPNPASGSTNPAPAPGAMAGTPPADAGAAMGAAMGEMMKQMGKPPRKELYPSLMAFPDEVTPQERAGIEQLAYERMKSGTAQMSLGLEKLSNAASDENYAAMQQATELTREGLAEFDAGIAAQRVLSEGKTPRNLALDWFKREMNLALPVPPQEPRTLFGVTPFHLFTMVLLVLFALAMVAMYFFKMRRAAALFGRLGPDQNPAPGSSPPLAGAPKPPPPAAPPPGGAPPADISKPPAPAAPPGGAPPPADAPKQTSPPPPPAGSEAASALPVAANWRGQLRLGSIVTETPSVRTLRLLPSSNDRFLPFTFLPGQFLNVAFWIGGARMNRSYSISSSPNEREYVELTIRREPRGAVSRHIDDLLKIGDQIEAGGPVGKFTFSGTEAESIVLIAGGVGITPMMSISRYLTERSWGGDIFFIYTCRTPADFIFANKIGELQRRNPNLHVAVTISKPEGTDWKGARGRITKEWLTQTIPDLASRMVHLCGPPSMMDSIKAIFTELGAAPEHLMTEAFGAVKPAPDAPGTLAKPTGPATGPLVTFSKNGKSAKIHMDLRKGDSPPRQSILELSEELSIGIEFSCRVGTCGVCKTKMTSGDVDQEVQDALDDDDKSKNIILACQAKPKVDVTVEA